MDFVYWVFVAVVVVALLFGLKDFLSLFLWSWGENGVGYTIKLILFFVLLFAPGVVKMFEPDYFGLAVWVFVLYSLSLLFIRFSSGKHKKEIVDDDLSGNNNISKNFIDHM